MRNLTMVLLVWATCGWQQQSEVRITVRAMPQVAGTTFTLGEIAEIVCRDSSMQKRLSSLEIGAAPLHGLTRRLGLNDVTVRLRGIGIDLKTTTIVFPPGVKVGRLAVEVVPDELVSAARVALELARAGQQNEVAIEPVLSGIRLFVPPGKREYVAGAPSGSLDKGSVTVPVSVLVDGKPTKTIDIAFNLTPLVTAIVPIRTIEAGSEISASDVSESQVGAPAVGEPITDLVNIVGKKARVRLTAGKPILASAVISPPLITSGSAVTVLSIVGALRIEAKGIAKQAGAAGEKIAVQLAASTKLIRCIVIDSTTVRVEAP